MEDVHRTWRQAALAGWSALQNLEERLPTATLVEDQGNGRNGTPQSVTARHRAHPAGVQRAGQQSAYWFSGGSSIIENNTGHVFAVELADKFLMFVFVVPRGTTSRTLYGEARLSSSNQPRCDFSIDGNGDLAVVMRDNGGGIWLSLTISNPRGRWDDGLPHTLLYQEGNFPSQGYRLYIDGRRASGALPGARATTTLDAVTYGALRRLANTGIGDSPMIGWLSNFGGLRTTLGTMTENVGLKDSLAIHRTISDGWRRKPRGRHRLGR